MANGNENDSTKMTIGARMRQSNEQVNIGRLVALYKGLTAAGRDQAAKLMGLIIPPKAEKAKGANGRGPSYEQLKADNSRLKAEVNRVTGLYNLLLATSDLTHDDFMEAIGNESEAAEEDVTAAAELLAQAKNRQSALAVVVKH